MKRYENEDIKRIAMRIKSARALTGFNQVEFCEKYDLSAGAFKTWEAGKFAPRLVNLQELCRCLENEGIFNATTSWFLKGEGPAPTHITANTASGLKPSRGEEEDNIIKEETELFKKNQMRLNKQVIVTEISDDLMNPYFLSGDIVGGVKIDKVPTFLEIKQNPFLIEDRPEHYLIRWIVSDGDSLFFKSQNDHLVFRIVNQKIGRVLWHRSFE